MPPNVRSSFPGGFSLRSVGRRKIRPRLFASELLRKVRRQTFFFSLSRAQGLPNAMCLWAPACEQAHDLLRPKCSRGPRLPECLAARLSLAPFPRPQGHACRTSTMGQRKKALVAPPLTARDGLPCSWHSCAAVAAASRPARAGLVAKSPAPLRVVRAGKKFAVKVRRHSSLGGAAHR